MPLLRARPRTELVVPISLSRDGDLQDVVMGGFGIESVRGSSSRGGLTALRQLIRKVRGGATCLLALDGPRGPRKRVKPGVTALVKHGHGELWLAAVAVSCGHRLVGAWDKFLLPAPWSKVVIEFYGPINLDPGASRGSQLLEIESSMEAASRSARSHLEE